MRSLSQTGLMLLVLFVLSSCYVQSVCAYYTEDAILQLPDLMGRWRPVNEKGALDPTTLWQFAEKELSVTEQRNEKTLSGALRYVCFKAGESRFLDLVAIPRETDSFFRSHSRAVHVLYRMQLGNGKLELFPLNYEWLAQMAKERTIPLPTVRDTQTQNTDLFTASREEWMAFLKKYEKEPQAFPENRKTVLHREGEQW